MSPDTRPGPRIGVTGVAVEDTIVAADGSVTEDLGGIVHAVATLAALLPGRARTVPILAVGSDAAERVRTDFGERPGVELRGLAESPSINNKVRLEYRTADEREETLTGGVGPLAWEALAPWIDRLDAWLWNFVSGMEADVATFARVKRAFDGPIHLDVHSLTLEHVHHGARRLRRPERWEAWVEGAATVQVNAREAALLWTGSVEPLTGVEESTFAARCHALGAGGVLLSRGRDGAAWLPAAGDPVEAAAAGVGDAIDPTGCGDVLGAAWVALRLGRGWAPADALAGAVRAAGAAAGIRGTRGLGEAVAAAVDGAEADVSRAGSRAGGAA